MAYVSPVFTYCSITTSDSRSHNRVKNNTVCAYALRKGDLFVLSWERVRRVRRGSIVSELLMCGGGVHSILLFPLVASCLETIYVCIWRMFSFMSVVLTVGIAIGNWALY